MSDHAADALTPRELLELQQQGRRAALHGHHPSSCPWGHHRPRDRERQQAWIRGYAAGRTELRENTTSEPADS